MNTTLTRLVIALGLTAGLVSAFIYVQVLLAQNAVDLTTALQTIANREAVANEYKVVNSLLEETVAQRNELASYIIDGDTGTIAFLTALENRAVVYGVMLVDTRLEPSPQTTLTYDALSVSISFSGTKRAVEAFITDVEAMPYALYITNMTTQRQSGNGGVVEVSGTLTLLVSAINIDV